MADYNLGTARGKIEIDSSGVQKSSDDATKAVGGFAAGLSDVGDTFTKKVTPIAAGIAVAAGAISQSWNGAQRDIAATTGATGAELDKYMDNVQHIAGTVKGSVGDIASVISDLAVKTHLTGPPLEDLAKKLLALKEIGQQVTVPDVAGAFGKWGVSADQWGDSLDRLLKVTQATGTPVATLLTRLADFEPVLKPFGFNMQQASQMVAKLGDESLPGLKKALTGIVQNHQDASKATLANAVAQKAYDEAVKAHGPASLEAQLALQKLQKSQKDVADSSGTLRSSFDGLIGSIKNAKTDQEALSIATEAFGTRAAPAMSQAIRSGKFDFDAMTGAIDANKNTIVGTAEAHRTLIDKLGLLKDRVTAMIGPYSDTISVVATVISGIGPAVKGVQGAIGVVGNVSDWFSKLKSVGDSAAGVKAAGEATKVLATGTEALKGAGAAGVALDTLAAGEAIEGTAAGAATVPTLGLAAGVWAILAPVLIVVGVIAGLIGWFLILTKVFGLDVPNAIGIMLIFLAPMIGIPLLIIHNWEPIAGFFSGLWDAVKGFFSGAVDFIAGIPGRFGDIVGSIIGFVSRLPGEIGRLIGDVVRFFTELPGKILGAIGDIAGRMAEVGRNIVMGIIHGIEGLAGAVADKIKSVVTAPLDAAKSIFGMSPSPLFIEKGKNMMDGLIVGLQARLPNFTDQLVAIGGAMPSVSNQSTSTNTSKVINVHMPATSNVMDEDALKNTIVKLEMLYG